ncbi:hypothetical protein SAMN06297144_2590 [Sphingomonas guangdongensis]|uniref:Uncharacterized protein n=1 Tax=Sphingomonas guangdongensis TaxID=1141890 RepID=A0A285R0Z3_9SPHN|nr:hypothetical protein [Sphingomonas guangdongensis]SOB87458.1 hypothetical protein SAMN06297144_2590 [Sphingomonas guangdongensis]
MKRTALFASLASLSLLAACGGDDIVVTNENNVVLNDAIENYAVTNDGEVAANDAAPMNATDGNMMMSNNSAMNGTEPTANAM